MYRVYVNGRHGGYAMLEREGRRPPVAMFSTPKAAEAEIAARGFINSVSVDRTEDGQRLPHKATTAYVIAGT